jgi:hypothetical protein
MTWTRDQLLHRAVSTACIGLCTDDLAVIAQNWERVGDDWAFVKETRRLFREWDRAFNCGKQPWTEMG